MKKEQDAGFHGLLAMSAAACIGMSYHFSCLLQLNRGSYSLIYGSLVLLSNLQTQSSSLKIVSDTPKVLAKCGVSCNSKQGLHASKTVWGLF